MRRNGTGETAPGRSAGCRIWIFGSLWREGKRRTAWSGAAGWESHQLDDFLWKAFLGAEQGSAKQPDAVRSAKRGGRGVSRRHNRITIAGPRRGKHKADACWTVAARAVKDHSARYQPKYFNPRPEAPVRSRLCHLAFLALRAPRELLRGRKPNSSACTAAPPQNRKIATESHLWVAEGVL